MSKLSFRGVNVTNGSFQVAFTFVRTVGARLRTTGVCTLVVPNLRNSAFLLRIFKILGAEGGTLKGFHFTVFFAPFSNSLAKWVLFTPAPTVPSALNALRCTFVVHQIRTIRLKSVELAADSIQIKCSPPAQLIAQRRAAKLGGAGQLPAKEYEWFNKTLKAVLEICLHPNVTGSQLANQRMYLADFLGTFSVTTGNIENKFWIG
jgi:hypothetical protein